jgi:hypothetical protein
MYEVITPNVLNSLTTVDKVLYHIKHVILTSPYAHKHVIIHLHLTNSDMDELKGLGFKVSRHTNTTGIIREITKTYYVVSW